MDLGLDLFLVQKKNGIEQILPFPLRVTGRTADQYPDIIGMLLYHIHGFVTLVDEVLKLQKITGRVSADTELGKEDQVCDGGFGLPDAFNDFSCIFFEISDMIILMR